MTKKIEWVNEDKMLFESGHKTFDRQTNIITTGNIIANTLLGKHIRAYTELSNGFEDRPPGHLQNFDLCWWRDGDRMPRSVIKKIRELAYNNGVWVYQLMHYNRQRVVHGYVVTNEQHKALATFLTGPTYKSSYVLIAALPYLADDINKAEEYYLNRSWCH